QLRNEHLANGVERLRDRLQLAGRREIADLRHERVDERHGDIGAKETLLELVQELGRERLLLLAAEKSREETAARLREALLEAHGATARARGTRAVQRRTRGPTTRYCAGSIRRRARPRRSDPEA